ncbi:MAG: PLP-dependent transferase, partial [Anaerolineales bacterium]|nr:PLP-dependent transferase [Anaerolineales bacterium]
MTLLNNSHDFTTHAIHAGRHPHSSAVPIYQGINAPIDDGSTKYISEVGAVGGPTVAALETAVSTLESANWCLAVPSGMAAISLTLLALLQRGDRIIAHRCIYTYATHFLNQDLSQKWGVEVVWVDMRNLDELQAALQQPTRLVYFEPIANP